jgi:hypothetical protein
VVEDDPVGVVAHLGFVPNSTGFPSRPFAIGRASGSCRLAPPGRSVGDGAGHLRLVWVAIRRVAMRRLLRSFTARISRLRCRPAAASDRPSALRRAAWVFALAMARFAFVRRRSASFAAVSARRASSAFLRRTTANASSFAAALRVRSFAF